MPARPSLISLLAQTPRLIDLLPHLHQHALERTGGSCSLLLEYNPGTSALHPTSAFALSELRTDPWTPGAQESGLVASTFSQRTPTLVAEADRQLPDLASRLRTCTVLLLPLMQASERMGILAVGFSTPPSPELDATDVADAFVTALQLFRLRQKEELQRDLQDLLGEFSASLSGSLNLSSGLDEFCRLANRLFGADSTAVWLYDRRARHLELRATSGAMRAARGVRVSAEDALAPAAAGMRRPRAEVVPGPSEAPTSTVTVPLRGRRRALGTVVFDGVRVEAGDELDLLGRADEIGRQLSSAIENMQLLDDVMRQRSELENIFNSIAHLVVVSDRQSRIVHVNEAFANRLNTTRDRLLDQPLSEVVGEELSGLVARHERTEGGDCDPEVGEIFDPRLNGPFMVTITTLLDQERRRVGTVLVARDLTPQSRLEAEREELRQRLTQSEKLAALGQFVAGIAHELNNPLQGVLGHLELMRSATGLPKHARRDVRTVYREADRAAKIVRNLLVFAGSKRMARRAISLNAVLQKVLALRQPAFRALDIEVVRHYEDHLPRLQGDPLLLHQVFLNIVMNAEQAVAAAGRPGRLEVGTAVAGGGTLVATVRDTGNGIPPDALARIFEPFYTTKEVGKGTGLGLAIVYGIVQEHGGQISAANHPEGGALFTVELPVAAPER
jgi:PAS domain S-box-containing protein